MTDRFSRLRDLNSQFGFLLNTKSLLLQQVPDGVDDIDTELRSQCLHFGKIYNNDVNGKELFQEVLDCRLLIKDRQQKGSEFEHPTRPQELLTLIISYGDDVFSEFENCIADVTDCLCFDSVFAKGHLVNWSWL